MHRVRRVPQNLQQEALIDALRTDIASLDNQLSQAAERLTNLQRALIDLLEMLDPVYLEFPRDRRSKMWPANLQHSVRTSGTSCRLDVSF